MESKLNVFKLPRFAGVRDGLKRFLSAVVEGQALSSGAAANWLMTNPMLQYRHTNFDLFLMDHYDDVDPDA